MAIYSITYRIHEDDTYDARRESLIAAIQKEAADGPWDEMTSQAIIESSKSSSELCEALYYGSTILESKDRLLVINLSVKSQDHKGLKYPHTFNALIAKR